MNEDHAAIPRQYDIRIPRKRPVMQPEPHSETVQPLPDNEFRSSILAADTGHHAASGSRIDNVCHQAARSFCCRIPSLSSMIPGFMMRATSVITGTTTEFPNCL